jgi:prepilin-type N-terminal cleavage/methylation domain-containing protein
MRTVERASRAARGFSMIELLVTVVLAGIIFAAMVPVFASALKRTSGDNLRVTATNIAQDRLEKVRQLAYADITVANLNSSTFAYPQFVTTYYPVGSSKAYTIACTVDTYPSYKKVTVTVVWSGSGPNYTTTMKTIVMDPAAISATSTSNPYPTPTAGYTLTVAFKDARQLISPYVTVKYVQDGVTKTATPSPAAPFPLPSKTSTVTYYGLPGGINIPYTVTCRSSYISSSAPVFHLLTNGWIKFDTHPGGS